MKIEGKPLYRLLAERYRQGHCDASVFVYAAGGYYYPGVFQPFGGFADGIAVENGRVRLPDIPGVGFEAKSNLYRELSTLIGS